MAPRSSSSVHDRCSRREIIVRIVQMSVEHLEPARLYCAADAQRYLARKITFLETSRSMGEAGYVQIDGARLAFERFGERGTPVLLIMGFTAADTVVAAAYIEPCSHSSILLPTSSFLDLEFFLLHLIRHCSWSFKHFPILGKLYIGP